MEFETKLKVDKALDDVVKKVNAKAFIKGIPYFIIGAIVCPLILVGTIMLKPHVLVAMLILGLVLCGFVYYMTWILKIMSKKIMNKMDWDNEVNEFIKKIEIKNDGM